MTEEWKSIKDYEGLYEVSSLGKVKSIERYVERGNHLIFVKEKILSAGKDKDGYLQVMLSKNGKQRMRKVHRLVAETFIPNKNHLPMINHKNEIKYDNRVENLEWCDNTYNLNYGSAPKQRKDTAIEKGKAVVKKSIDGKILEYYPSLREAGRLNKTTATQIRRVCQGKQHTCMGFKWELIPKEMYYAEVYIRK